MQVLVAIELLPDEDDTIVSILEILEKLITVKDCRHMYVPKFLYKIISENIGDFINMAQNVEQQVHLLRLMDDLRTIIF